MASGQDKTEGKAHLSQWEKSKVMINLCHCCSCSGADADRPSGPGTGLLSWCLPHFKLIVPICPQVCAAALLLKVPACCRGVGKWELCARASQLLPHKISVWPKIIMNVCSCRTLSFAEWERRSMRVALPALLHGHYSLERGSCQTWYGERSCSSSCSVCSCGRVPILVCLRQQAVLEFLLGSRWQKVGRIRTAWLCDQLGFC